jgi:chromosome segregation ATPase
MPRNRGRRGEPNEEASGTEESYVNGLGGNNSNNRAAVFGEDADDMGHDHINNNPSGGKPRQHRGASSSQHKYKQGLGPWTEAVAEATRSMGATHKAINDLQSRFELHLNDLKMMEETKDKLAHLEEECREKEDEIRKQEGTINTLVKVNSNIQEKIKHEREDIEQERKMLDQERAKLEKRVNAAMAEERHKLRSEFDILITQHGQSHDKRKKELEDEFRAQREENNRRLTLLETENSQLSTTMEEQKNTIGDLRKQLEKTTEQCDVLERAKDSVKKDKLAIERELEMMKREFALSPKSKEYLCVF